MRIATTLWRSTHPGPTLIVTAIAIALGVAAGLDPIRLSCLALSVLAGQVSVGLSNDAIDARRDRANGRADKPLAAPDAPVTAVWVTAITSVVLAVGLSAVLSGMLAVVHSIALASAWAYNLVLKSTALSAMCFVVSFGLFPSTASLALPDPQFAPPWAWLTGSAFGIAVHFSNVLPDLDDDRRTGVRGLPHRIGGRASAVIAFGALTVGAAVALLGPLAGSGARPLGAWAVGAVVAAVAAGGLADALLGAPSRRSFRLVMLAAMLLAAQLVVTGWTSVG